MNSIFVSLSEEVDNAELSEYILAVQYDFSKGAIKTGVSNLKAIREIFVHENVPEYLIEALDAFIKAIICKKFDDPKTSRKTIEKIMFIIYPVEDEEDDEYNTAFVLEQSATLRELNRMDDEEDEDDEDEEDEDDEDDEEEDDDDEEEDDDDEEDDDVVDRYNDLLKNKTLNKYIVAKRFKITKDDEEDKEKIEGLYKLVKNICNNFSSDKDADNLLSVLEELDELRE